MSISFKDIQPLSGPLGQVVDGTQNANSHNGGRTVVEEDKIKDVIRFMAQTLLCFYPAANTAVNLSSDPLHGLICDESDELSECGTCCNSLNVTGCHVMLKLGDVADGAATECLLVVDFPLPLPRFLFLLLFFLDGTRTRVVEDCKQENDA